MRENDGRKNRIKLTDDGIKLIKDGEKKIRMVENKILSCLSEEEYNILLGTLRKIIINNKMGVDIDD